MLFTNGPELFDNTYQRYLLKTFRDQLPFHEVPIKLVLRDRTDRKDDVPDREESLAELPDTDPVATPTAPAKRPAARKRKKPAPKTGKSSRLWHDV